MKAITVLSVAAVLAAGCASTGQGPRARESRDVAQLSALMGGELQALWQELGALRESVDAMRLHLDAMGAPAAPPVTPAVMPTDSVEAPGERPRTITFGPKGPESPADVEAPPLNIVSEWGRTLETAAELDKNSLKGMACFVPAGTQRPALERLGRDLRDQYGDYDNISIDVFDDEEAARLYARSPAANAAHRVLKIAKFKETGQDVVVVYHEGRALPVF